MARGSWTANVRCCLSMTQRALADFVLLTASEDSVLYWNLDMSTWADAACRAAGSELTKAEWQQWGPRDTDPHALCG